MVRFSSPWRRRPPRHWRQRRVDPPLFALTRGSTAVLLFLWVVFVFSDVNTSAGQWMWALRDDGKNSFLVEAVHDMGDGVRRFNRTKRVPGVLHHSLFKLLSVNPPHLHGAQAADSAVVPRLPSCQFEGAED